MIRAALFISAALLASACSQPAEPGPEPQSPAELAQDMPQTKQQATEQDACGASQYAALVGAPLAAVTLPAEAHVRIIQPGTVATQDFRPERANIIVDAEGIIIAVECY